MSQCVVLCRCRYNSSLHPNFPPFLFTLYKKPDQSLIPRRDFQRLFWHIAQIKAPYPKIRCRFFWTGTLQRTGTFLWKRNVILSPVPDIISSHQPYQTNSSVHSLPFPSWFPSERLCACFLLSLPASVQAVSLLLADLGPAVP